MVSSVTILPTMIWRPMARTTVTLSVKRDGADTAGKKLIVLSGDLFDEARYAAEIIGAASAVLQIPVQVLADRPVWVARITDATPPAKIAAQLLEIATSDAAYVLNISTGTGGETGTKGHVTANVRVDGAPANREVVFVERKLSGDWRYAGHGAPVADGTEPIEVDVVDGQIYAIGLDDFGLPFTPSVTVEVGRRIRPSVFTGWLYEVTEAGTLPATEPEWWPAGSPNTSQALGTARVIAVRYYQPLAHGPVPVLYP